MSFSKSVHLPVNRDPTLPWVTPNTTVTHHHALNVMKGVRGEQEARRNDHTANKLLGTEPAGQCQRRSCGIGPHHAAPAGTVSVEETPVPTQVLDNEAPV